MSESTRNVKIKVEISNVNFKYENQGTLSDVLDLAIKVLTSYQQKIEGE